jgi:hypothetical protein
MAADPKVVALVDAGVQTILTRYEYADPPVEPKNNSHSAALAPQSIIDNTAYHDYQRIELGTPVITTQIVDKTIPSKLTGLLDIVASLAPLFSANAKTAVPTDADEAEQLVADIKADLDVLAAGAIPPVLQSFIVGALGDYLSQDVWNAFSIAQRDRLGQLASLWAILMFSASVDSTGSAAPTTVKGSATFIDVAEDIIDPRNWHL